MIRLENVSKVFDVKVLDNFNLDIEDKKTTVILGKSGSGKTTIINLILGLIKPDEGKITGTKNTVFSVVFQEDRLLENLTVLKNLTEVCKDEKLCKQALENLELSNVQEKFPAELSGGMKRRVALARAMAYNGNLFIIDEPFKGIDVALKEKVIGVVKTAMEGKTSVVITHEIEEAVKIGDTIVILGGTPLRILKTVDNTKKDKGMENYIKEFIMKNTESDF